MGSVSSPSALMGLAAPAIASTAIRRATRASVIPATLRFMGVSISSFMSFIVFLLLSLVSRGYFHLAPASIER